MQAIFLKQLSDVLCFSYFTNRKWNQRVTFG